MYICPDLYLREECGRRRGGEDVISVVNHVVGITEWFSLCPLSSQTLETLPSLHQAQGLGVVDCVSVSQYLFLYPLDVLLYCLCVGVCIQREVTYIGK